MREYKRSNVAYIKRDFELKTKEYIVIDVNGIGYKIFMPQSSTQNLGESY